MHRGCLCERLSWWMDECGGPTCTCYAIGKDSVGFGA